jgi:DNA-binding LytR/AlgR family response regulator
MIKTVIIEDEPLALSLVEGFVERNEHLELQGSFTNPIEGLDFIRENAVDLILLDINMPDLDGIELAKLVYKKVKIIFTTAYRDFALDGFKLNAVDYLLKPFDYKEFSRAVEKAKSFIEIEALQHKKEEFIHVRADHKQYKVALDEILYIENVKNYVIFRLVGNKKIMALMSLKSLSESLPKHFLKVHRSFIINSDKIDSTTASQITIDGNGIPISEANRKWFKEWMAEKALN